MEREFMALRLGSHYKVVCKSKQQAAAFQRNALNVPGLKRFDAKVYTRLDEGNTLHIWHTRIKDFPIRNTWIDMDVGDVKDVVVEHVHTATIEKEIKRLYKEYNYCKNWLGWEMDRLKIVPNKEAGDKYYKIRVWRLK